MTRLFVLCAIMTLSCGESLPPSALTSDSSISLDVEADSGGSLNEVKGDTTPQSVEACPAIDLANGEHKDLYYHNIKSMPSTDGLNFDKNDTILLDHASVPEGVIRPNGDVWVYFVSGQPGQHALFIAKQLANGTLETFDCVRIDGAINGNAVDPDVVLLDDGRTRMFFFEGWFVGGKKEDSHPFYSAISEDGIHFTLEHKVLEVDGGGTDPTVARLDGESWLMAIAFVDSVLLAKSEDGKTFTLTGQSLPKGIPELARFDDGLLRLYIASREGLLIHRSEDLGQSWTEEKVVPMGGADPSLIQRGPNEWTLFYKGFSPKN